MKLTPSPDWSNLVPIQSGREFQISIDESLPSECRRLRPEIHSMLLTAAKSLPKECRLHVFEAFRTQSRQFSKWNKRIVELGREFPNEELPVLIKRCKNDIADPVNQPSGHQGGTAIDVTIFENNKPLDMGGEFADFSKHDLIATNSPLITKIQSQNRMRVKDCMEGVGFINYNEEWWHYSYQDRLWAAMQHFGNDKQEVDRSLYKYGACYGGTAGVSERFMDYLDFR